MIRIFNALFYSALAIWLGSSVVRLVVRYDAFVPGTTTLKGWYTPDQLHHTIWLYAILAAWTGWSFGVMAVGGFASLLAQRKQFRQQAWMLMVLIFIVLLVPAQVWHILADVELWNNLDPNTGRIIGNPEHVTSIFVEQMTSMSYSIVNGLSILMGITIVSTLAMRPLTLARNPEPPSTPS